MSPSLDGAVGIRTELTEAIERLVAHWARPGTSWTAIQRWAIVDLARTARSESKDLPPWQSPRSVVGLIADDTPLDDLAVDAAWRITAHPSTLTRAWHSQLIEGGMDPTAFVELVSVAAMANALVYFCDSVGIEFPTAPPLVDGPPTSDHLAAKITGHWVPTVESNLPNVREALSAVPDELELQGILLDAMYVPGGALGRELDEDVWSLERTQVELVASRISTLNECFY